MRSILSGSAGASVATPRHRAAEFGPEGLGEPELDGYCVLVVEDEMLLALDLEEGLRDAGCVVVGPVGNLRSALQLAREEPAMDAAILDVNLAGERVFPVAETLSDRGVPFVFATAYASSDDLYPWRVKSAPRLSKPYTVAQALATLRALLAR